MKTFINITKFSLLVLILASLSACNSNPNQVFGFKVIDDADTPYAEISTIYAENNMNYDYVIEYLAADISGIENIALYINDNVDNSVSIDYYNNEIHWQSGEQSGELSFKLEVTDNAGKTGWSEAYLYDLKKIYFEEISLSYYIRDVKKFSDGSLWLVSEFKVMKYNNNTVVLEFDIPENDFYFHDFFIADNGDMYASLMQYGHSYRCILYRYRNGSWQELTYSNSTYYSKFIEKEDGSVYALSTSSDDDTGLVEISTGDMIIIDLPPSNPCVYQIGIYSDGELCFSDLNGLKKLVDGEWEYIFETVNLSYFIFDSNYNIFHYGYWGGNYIYFNNEIIAEFDYYIKDTAISSDDRFWAVFGFSIVTHKEGETIYLLDDYFHNLPSNFIPKKVEVSEENDVYIVGGGELHILKEDQYINFK